MKYVFRAALLVAVVAMAFCSVEICCGEAVACSESYRGEELARFTTDYSHSSEARRHNVELAAKLLDGYTIGSGDTFSFNNAVGVRSVARGFREAPVIEYGKFVSGVGGGVCQVSSTLYNAVIAAGLDVLDVAHHSLPVSYLPLSLDAMVSDTSDFRFVNETPYPLFIRSHTDGSKLTFILYGFPIITDGESVKIRSVTVKKLECTEYERVSAGEGDLAEGESEKYISHPRPGIISEAYRDYYYGGKLVRSERLRRDYYAPKKGVIAVRSEDEGILAAKP